jgi:hypothetical protein
MPIILKSHAYTNMYNIGLTIGFEQTRVSLRENNTVTVCIRVLHPDDPNTGIESRQYIVAFNVDFMSGPNSKL